MKYNFSLLIIFTFLNSNSQTINLNESYLTDYLRTSQLLGDFKSEVSFTLKPFDIGKNGIEINKEIFDTEKYAPTVLSFLKGNGKIKILPVDYNIEFNSHHPYNRNNGSMIPNRGYQHILSAGVFAEIGPLSIQLKPEHLFAENLNYDGFSLNHYDATWAKRYLTWNKIDIPERFGEKRHNKTLIGQSSIRLNFKGLSIGLSNENIWWGPSIRNSIMMSNHARGFKHITFNSISPIETKIGSFEWQFVTGRLELSGFTPPEISKEYAGTLLYIPKGNQTATGYNDWRYFQGFTFTYSPKWLNGLSLGFIKWAQLYGGLLEGKYTWIDSKPNYFPVFDNLFSHNKSNVDIDFQIDQAAGVFFRWLMKDSKAEIYSEIHYNDSKNNLRDLLLDSNHASAMTLGFQKVFSSNKKNLNYLFSWEWTRLEQKGSRLIRNAGSWYTHTYVNSGYTHGGEVLGAGIGPGSNSHFFSFSKINKFDKIGLSFEIIDQDNDFYFMAFEEAKDFRRYWKDFNFHVNFYKRFKNIWLSSNLIYTRSLNYHWELEDYELPYYHPGNDVDNFHANIKLTYLIPLAN
jgi:hypothetical protein